MRMTIIIRLLLDEVEHDSKNYQGPAKANNKNQGLDNRYLIIIIDNQIIVLSDISSTNLSLQAKH